MRRRIILIVIVFALLGCLVGGIVLYARRSSGLRLLARANVAIQANQFDKAVELAGRYVQGHPDDWRGYYVQAKALMHLGRYEDALKPLDKAKELSPEQASVLLTLADAYALPAKRLLFSWDPARPKEPLLKSIDNLRKANETLAGITSQDEALSLRVQEIIGINVQHLGTAHRCLSQRLDREAQLARAAGGKSGQAAEALAKESQVAIEKAEELFHEATKVLLEVIRRDPARDSTAQVLIKLCLERDDRKSLAAAGSVILSAEDPPPIAAMMLALNDLRSSAGAMDLQARRQKLTETCEILDELIRRHPDKTEVKVARAELALTARDLKTAEMICMSILEAQPTHPRATLIHAQVLTKKGELKEAEKQLFELKTQLPRWVPAHVAYAKVALERGRKEVARESMRTVVQLAPGHPEASWYLAKSLMEDGFYQQAFADARTYYREHPSDPRALELLAETAVRANQQAVAQEALQQAQEKHPSDPRVLVAVAEGYSSLGDEQQALKAAGAAVKCQPKDAAERLAVARALSRLNRTSEAETILLGLVSADPEFASAQFELARVYSRAGRLMQAVEHYRATAQLVNANSYRLALARALRKAGLLDESLAECRRILARDPSNPSARLLANQISVIQGRDVDAQEMAELVSTGKAESGLPLALAYLNAGQPQRCVDVCRAELKKTSGAHDVRLLLGKAYLELGRKQECIQQWSELVRAAPGDISTYLLLAGLWYEHLPLDEALEKLRALPNARGDIVDLVSGWLLLRMGKPEQAEAVYRRVAQNTQAPEHTRRLAQLEHANCLVRLGRIGPALAEFDRLSQSPPWRQHALLGKAQTLVAARRGDEAEPILEELSASALKQRNRDLLRRVVALFSQAGKTDRALAACKLFREAVPSDPSGHLLEAAMLTASGRRADAIPHYEKAIEMQPGNIGTHISLAMALEAEHEPLRALEALDRLEEVGQTGYAAALFERGTLFARMGLHAKAIENFEKLIKLGHGRNPKLNLRLGEALGQLGETDKAREQLEGIPRYAAEYVPARQLLAEMAKTPEKKLDALRKLTEEEPGNVHVLAQQMSTLLRQNRPADAIKAFDRHLSEDVQHRPLASALSELAITAMLRAGDVKGAAALSRRMFQQSGSLRWRRLAGVLLLEDQPDVAAGMLPETSEARYPEALLGFLLARSRQDAKAMQSWSDRLGQIGKSAAESGQPQATAVTYGILVALVEGNTPQAKSKLDGFPRVGSVTPSVVAELVERSGQAQTADEAAKLIRASLALDVGARELGQKWAMEVLESRPTCQWAAALVLQSGPAEAQLREVLDILQPATCPLSHRILGAWLEERKQYEQAAAAYAEAAKSDPGDVDSLFRQAAALENAGKLAEAFALYSRVWEQAARPAAANNLAYLTAQLWPGDTEKLTRAAKWAEAAVSAVPQVAAFRDTLGWVAHLRGQHEQACRQLRRAVKGLPDSPEVHCHLGLAEAAAGNEQLARWHLAAATRLGKKLEAEGKPISKPAAEAIRLAQEALAKM